PAPDTLLPDRGASGRCWNRVHPPAPSRNLAAPSPLLAEAVTHHHPSAPCADYESLPAELALASLSAYCCEYRWLPPSLPDQAVPQFAGSCRHRLHRHPTPVHPAGRQPRRLTVGWPGPELPASLL